jgi:antitoxin ParD1/3/4
MNVSLKNDWETYIATKVASGEFDTASEVIRAGLRLLKREDEERQIKLNALRQEIAGGFDQLRRGEGRPADQVFTDLFAGLNGKNSASA